MITEFLNYISSVKGYSDNTVVAYGKDLHDFVQYVKDIDTKETWRTITQGMIQSYVVSLHERDLENTTIKRRVAAIRSIYDYFKTQGYISENPARFVQTPKKVKKLPNTISAGAIRDALESTRTPLKTKCMIALMIETGIRLQEMLDLETKDFQAANRSIRILGKGGKERTVYYGDWSRKYLNQYVGYRKGRLFDDEQRDVRREVFETLSKFTQARQLSPHAIRHTFATTMLRNGADIKSIQALLGHESVKTTEIYAQVAGPQVATQYELFAPKL